MLFLILEWGPAKAYRAKTGKIESITGYEVTQITESARTVRTWLEAFKDAFMLGLFCRHHVVQRRRFQRGLRLSPRESANRQRALRSYIAQDAPTLKPGDSVDFAALGYERLPSLLQRLLESRGMAFCTHLKTIFPLSDMVPHGFPRRSLEARYRMNIFANAMYRSRHRGMPVDRMMLKQMAFGELPLCFNGAPYRDPTSIGQKGGSPNSLSVDRINNCLRVGYVRGNVRFMPRWLNMCLQDMTDAEALLIFQRFCGQAKTLPTGSLDMKSMSKSDIQKLHVKVQHCAIFGKVRRISRCSEHPHWRSLLELPLPKVCPFTGLHLHWLGGRGRVRSDSAALDHIDPRGGNRLENLRWISSLANLMKQDKTDAEHAATAASILHLQSAEYRDSHIPLCART